MGDRFLLKAFQKRIKKALSVGEISPKDELKSKELKEEVLIN